MVGGATGCCFHGRCSSFHGRGAAELLPSVPTRAHPHTVSVAVAVPPGSTTGSSVAVLDAIDDIVSPAIIELNRAHYAIKDSEPTADDQPCPASARWYRLYEQLADGALTETASCPDSHMYTLAGGLLLQEADDMERRAAQLPRQPGRARRRAPAERAAALARNAAATLLHRGRALLRKSLGKVVAPSTKPAGAPPAAAESTAVETGEAYVVGGVPYFPVQPQLAVSQLDDVNAAMRAARLESELDALAVRAAQGDRRALAELLDRIRGPIVSQCRARMGGRTIGQQTAEDIAQEVLIAVCEALSRFRPAETRWMAFVYGIVRSKVIDAYRAAGRDRSEPREKLPDHVDDDRARPEAAVLRSADRALLHGLLADLPEAQREVLGLRVAMGYSAEETARMIGSTPGAVRVTQHRALVKLRALLAQRMADRPTGSPSSMLSTAG